MKIQTTITAALLFILPGLAWADRSDDRPHHNPEVTQGDRKEMVRELLQRVKTDYPKKYTYLMQLREDDPRAFRQAMRKMHAHYNNPRGKDDPAFRAEKERLLELRDDLRSAVNDYQSAGKTEQIKIRDQITDIVEEIFDAKQEIRRTKLSKMRADLKRLEAELAEREQSRDSIISSIVDNKINKDHRGK